MTRPEASGKIPAFMQPIQIGNRLVGPDQPAFIVAEIGINHNGDLEIAKQLIKVAVDAGCDAVKFQKRTVDVVYNPAELARPRESPFGETNGDLKRGLEFGFDEYSEIDRICREEGIVWFASCWDEGAVDFIEQFDPPCFKIASACLTHTELLQRHTKLDRPVFLSTGMSTLDEIDEAVKVLTRKGLALMHCTSSYPCTIEELNLKLIPRLMDRYDVPIGYSGHEVGLYTTLAAVVLGACAVERHITLDRAMWGSDQASSIEPHGLARLVKDIRAVELAMGDGIKRVYNSEIQTLQKLRRVAGD
jgi:N-acetylneuraminate synthase